MEGAQACQAGQAGCLLPDLLAGHYLPAGTGQFSLQLQYHGAAKAVMDHAKISTTIKYVHEDADMKREIIAQLDALGAA